MKIKSGFVLEKVGTGYLAVAVGERAKEFTSLVRMNSTGAFLWGLIAERDLTAEQMLEEVLSNYEVSREQASADIAAFEKKLADNGILE